MEVEGWRLEVGVAEGVRRRLHLPQALGNSKNPSPDQTAFPSDDTDCTEDVWLSALLASHDKTMYAVAEPALSSEACAGRLVACERER